jgi:hypothetical protein
MECNPSNGECLALNSAAAEFKCSPGYTGPTCEEGTETTQISIKNCIVNENGISLKWEIYLICQKSL